MSMTRGVKLWCIPFALATAMMAAAMLAASGCSSAFAQDVPVAPVAPWLDAHWWYLVIGTLAYVAANLATALTPWSTLAEPVRILGIGALLLRRIADLISFSWQRGTEPHVQLGPVKFNMPGKLSTPPHVTAKPKRNRQKGFVRPGVLLALTGGFLLVAGVAGCCHFRGNCSKPVQGVIDCASTEVVKIQGQLGKAIMIILESGDYLAGLNSLVAQLVADGIADGPDILACILQRLLSPPVAGVKAAEPLTPIQIAHAQAWIAAQRAGAR